MSDYTATWPDQGPIDEQEKANLAAWTATHRPDRVRLRFRDETPEPTDTAWDLDAERAHVRQLANQHRGLSAPSLPLNIARRRERSVWRRVLRALTWKYRRVLG